MAAKLAEAIAQVMDARTGPVEDLDRAIEDAYETILGDHRSFLGLVDERTLASLLGDEEKVRALIELTALDAERQAAPGTADLLRARGRALLATLRGLETSERQRLLGRLSAP